MATVLYGSITRISDLRRARWSFEPVPRSKWRWRDYVIGEVQACLEETPPIELDSGRLIQPGPGDLMVGAFGTRSATLETVGDWTAIGDDLHMDALTGAGLFGRAQSRASAQRRSVPLLYRGHVVREGRRLGMGDYVVEPDPVEFSIPTILIMGSSMSAGKTTSAKVLISVLKEMGRSVVGAKLTGAARWQDALQMGDAGADHFFDFVDARLPSTIGPIPVVREALKGLLARIQSLGPDVLVAEVGASPLEPYNGEVAIAEVGDAVRFRVLCGSDPYSVVGLRSAISDDPDIVTGRAANTTAAVLMVQRLTGLRALDVSAPDARFELRQLLETALRSEERV